MNGLEVIEALQANYMGNFPKVIMISALMRDELIQVMRQRLLQPDVILHKPVSQSVLLEALLDQRVASNTSTSNSVTSTRFSGRVLVAEDNEVNQLVILNLLENLGIQADIAHNGAEAVQRCRRHSYDLIFMDIQMPIMDGFEAAQLIRTFNTNIPIVALSAAVMQQDKHLSAKAGMNGHLAKPIDLDLLTATLALYLPNEQKSITSDPPYRTRLPQVTPIPGIELDALLALFNDTAKVVSLLQTFANTQRDFCTKAKALAFNSEDLKRLVHGLKGVSGSIKATKTHQICVSIEQSEASIKAKLLPLLCTELNNVISAIDEAPWLRQPTRSASSLTQSELVELIASLEVKLTEKAFIPQAEREAVLQELAQRVDNQVLLLDLSNAFLTFDFEQATQLLHSIKDKLHE
jgi:CheY-like chemotaxis protein/HPt (histidine-containing phosphotransfer) domain-containing protein